MVRLGNAQQHMPDRLEFRLYFGIATVYIAIPWVRLIREFPYRLVVERFTLSVTNRTNILVPFPRCLYIYYTPV